MTEQAFPNYTQVSRWLPKPLWWIFRGLGLAIAAITIGLLFLQPETGLTLFWQLLIPALPLSFALFPGLWRNICPMALLNQLPRQFGFSRELTLSPSLRSIALFVSVALFLLFIFFRQPLFNSHAGWLATIILLALAVAFIGGLIFKGRSGWCGTFCPLAPIQKAYGHAPLLLVPNGYCPTCVGCQKNCYDFNPRAAIFSDLQDQDVWWSDQRKFFIGLLPGLIFGYFTTTFQYDAPIQDYLLSFLFPILISLGLFYALHNLLQVNFFRLSSLFSMTALSIFYWFAFPVMAAGLDSLFQITVPDSVIQGLQFTVPAVSLIVLIRGLISERSFKLSQQAKSNASLGKGVKKLKNALSQTGQLAPVVEQSSGTQMMLRPGQTLLDALEENELPIMSGCRMGMCGSDPVVITEGKDNLPPPDENELNTLKRLGLEGKARLACCCKPTARVVVDLEADPKQVESTADADEDATAIDDENAFKVIIIGNGIAGISTAEELRKLDSECKITLIGKEPYHFYNRMGLEAVVHGRSALQGLYLIKEEWYQRSSIDCWLNTLVTGIDREQHQVELGTGEKISYNKLVLATGANAFVPNTPAFQQPGVFVLRNAEDALDIRAHVQQHNCRRAVVLGGGVLGIEAADAMLQLGLSVNLVHADAMLMNRQLDLRAAVILKTFLQNRGIRVHLNHSIGNIKTMDEQMQVILDDGKAVIADLVLLCIGVRSETTLAKSAQLEVNRGVIVNQQMQTSDEDIYCVGDAAELPGAIGGLWNVGSEQGKIAARSLLGQEAVYQLQSLPPVQLKVRGIDLKSFGSFSDIPQDAESIESGEAENFSWRHVLLHNGKVIAGVFINSPVAANAAIVASKSANHYSRKMIEEMLYQEIETVA